ncbi:cell surface protein [Lactiplantibacillus fabifermentans T30PCM01]|uniref:Cell surface protein n=1 Tax=Lactiplantibacillus fabifermentans T30PCM01 TaxID=1400520 RepID=W6TAM4_9LACO|nr:SpaA isopeptide-forming pilin-related protein [Lactiplantibacillus fabifermentans]ETY75609.1 cell surface protein [Lactiplantibacillus fabifermentans T30PCM01]
MQIKQIKAFLAGTATLLTLLAANMTKVQADDGSTTATTKADAATMTSTSAAKAASQVTLRSGNQSAATSASTSAVSVSSGAATSSSSAVATSASSTSSSATASASSSAIASSSTATSVSSASAVSSSATDTTVQPTATSSTETTDSATRQSASQVQAQAKSANAVAANKQSQTTMYDATVTSQKGSSTVTPVTATQTRTLMRSMSFAKMQALATAAAKALAVSGVDANDATVTDNAGNVYSASDALSSFSSYVATYHWTIPDAALVTAGDSATVTLPSNVVFTEKTENIAVVTKDGDIVGYFSAAAGTQSGTLTFNDYYADNTMVQRGGQLTFNVRGSDTTAGDADAIVNKSGWQTIYNGQPVFAWDVVANMKNADWKNVTVVDNLGQYQTHFGSMDIQLGSYVNGSFVKTNTLGTFNFETNTFTYAAGVSAPQVTVNLNGNELSLHFDELTAAVEFAYYVSIDQESNIYTNSASATYTPADGTPNPNTGVIDPATTTVNAQITYGGSGTAGGTDIYQLVVTKTDAQTQRVLANATYELRDADGTVLQTNLTTNTSGQFIVGNLVAGTYLLVETAAPAGYELDETAHTIVISAANATNKLITANVTDTAKTGKVTVTKTDVATNQVLSGATFTLTNASGTVVASGVTDANGQVQFTGLAQGTYTLRETQAPSGYQLSNATQTVVIGETGTYDGQYSFTNTAKTGTITVNKADAATRQALRGATFTLTTSDGTVVATATTDATGQATFKQVAQGNYTLTEMQAPAGYLISGQPIEINIGETGTYQATYTVTNVAKVGQITITKTDRATQQALSGATFTLTNAAGQVVATKTTTDNGQVSFDNVAQGTYTLTETKAPTGYQIDQATQMVTIGENTTYAATLTFTDTLKTGQIQVLKTDTKTHQALAGATFTLTNAVGEVVATKVTSTNGQVVFEDIAQGTYTLTETVAPAGYLRDSVTQMVTIGETGTYAAQLTFTDTAKTGQIIVNKVDAANQQGLAGATFTLTTPTGQVVATATTNAQGTAIFNDVAQGAYQVTETNAPAGYQLDSQRQTVTIGETSTYLANLTFSDHAKTGTITVTKTDRATKHVLTGATFTLTDATGNVIATATTTASGTVTFNDLAQGVYTLTETSARVIC